MSNKGNGKGIQFLRSHVGYAGDDCLKWPLSTAKGYGRGMVGYNGKHYWAHRLMCIMAHGEPPTPDHEAAHECGNGHLACINPRHLKWKTRSENQQDCWRHGTQARSFYGSRGKLTPEQAEEIRSLQGSEITQKEIAARYGVSPSAITQVWKGITFSRPRKTHVWTAEEDATIRDAIARKLPWKEVAKAVGRPQVATYTRARRLGLHIQTGHHASKSRHVSFPG